MSSQLYLQNISTLFLIKLGSALLIRKYFNIANTCFNFALMVCPKSETYLQIADAYACNGKYKKAAELYKKAIGLQPTSTLVYYFGLKSTKNGSLNDEFYQSLLNVIETPEILLMIKFLSESPPIYQPSKFWLHFMVFNTFQIETGGIENFKRTINNYYFNWTGDSDLNKQFIEMKNKLNWSDSDILNAEMFVHLDSTIKPKEFTEEKWRTYIQYLCMLWEFTSQNDRLKLLNYVQEPILGNPIAIEYKGKIVTQDICNTVYEVNTFMEFVEHNPNEKMRVMELGAGHGRVGNVLLRAIKNIQVVIVDIPPALYVSQWYLTNLFPEHRIFKFRDFDNYSKVQQEFEESSICFLSPAQVECLPDKMFDLFINISSLHEMTPNQIEMWFGQIDRICKGWFYTKQYIENKNSFDDVVIRQEDYPVKPHWQELMNRRNPIFPELFEAVYKIY